MLLIILGIYFMKLFCDVLNVSYIELKVKSLS